MPVRDPNKTQLDFPLLVADLIQQLRLTGALGVLDFEPTVLPVFIIGDRGLDVNIQEIVWLPAENFAVTVVNPASGAILIDTGALPAGDYDVISGWTASSMQTTMDLQMQHRNAANAATLAFWPGNQNQAGPTGPDGIRRFALRLALNERLRYELVVGGGGVTSQVSCWMQVKRRVEP